MVVDTTFMDTMGTLRSAIESEDPQELHASLLKIQVLTNAFREALLSPMETRIADRQAIESTLTTGSTIEWLAHILDLTKVLLSDSTKSGFIAESHLLLTLDCLCNAIYRTASFQVLFTGTHGGIPALVFLLGTRSDRIRAYTARLLWSLCDRQPPAQDKVAQHKGPQALGYILPRPGQDAVDNWVLQQTCGAIWSMADHHPMNKKRFMSDDLMVVQGLIALLRPGNSDQLVFSALGAITALAWDNRGCQDYLRVYPNFVGILTFVTDTSKRSASDPWSNEVLSKAGEFISSFSSKNPDNLDMLQSIGVHTILLPLLSHSSVTVRAQAAGALYTLCAQNVTLQTLLAMMSNSPIESYVTLPALGALLRGNSTAQESMLSLIRLSPESNPGVSISPFLNHCITSIPREARKFVCVLEALYNCISQSSFGVKKVFLAPETNVMLFILRVSSFNNPNQPNVVNLRTKVLACECLRACTDGYPGAANQISGAVFRDLCNTLVAIDSQCDDPQILHLSTALATALSAISVAPIGAPHTNFYKYITEHCPSAGQIILARANAKPTPAQ